MPMAITVQIAGSQFMTISAAITPTATFAPVARIALGVAIPGALPQALYFCAYSARCLCDDCITLQRRSYKAKENPYFTESNLHAEKYKKQEGKRIKSTARK